MKALTSIGRCRILGGQAGAKVASFVSIIGGRTTSRQLLLEEAGLAFKVELLHLHHQALDHHRHRARTSSPIASNTILMKSAQRRSMLFLCARKRAGAVTSILPAIAK